MTHLDGTHAKSADPDAPAESAAAAQCDAACDAARESGPPREGGGTTGAGNLSPGQASRTGGATAGIGTDALRPAKAGQVPPSA